jgi:hypothetical protein
MKTGTNLILTHEEREILLKANNILLQFETTDAAKEISAENDWANANYDKDSFEIARSILLDTYNSVILKWEPPKK